MAIVAAGTGACGDSAVQPASPTAKVNSAEPNRPGALSQGLAMEAALFGVLNRVFSDTRIDAESDAADVRRRLEKVLAGGNLHGLRANHPPTLPGAVVQLDDYCGSVVRARIDGVDCVAVLFVRSRLGGGAIAMIQSCDSDVLVGIEREVPKSGEAPSPHSVECSSDGTLRDLIWMDFFSFVSKHRR